MKLRSQVMRTSCLEERRGCLPKSNCQIKRLEFILLLAGLWLCIRDRQERTGKEKTVVVLTDVGTKQQKYQAYEKMRKII